MLTYFCILIIMEEKDAPGNSMDIVELLKTDREITLRWLYRSHRSDFLHFAKRYHHEENDILDAFQEGMLAFYEYCIQDKFDPLKSSPKTMLFNMAKYALFKIIRKGDSSKTVELDGSLLAELPEVDALFADELSPTQLRLKTGLAQLGKQCQKIIRLFYFFEYSVDAIVEELGYQNANVVRSHKSRCMKRLRNYMMAATDQKGH